MNALTIQRVRNRATLIMLARCQNPMNCSQRAWSAAVLEAEVQLRSEQGAA